MLRVVCLSLPLRPKLWNPIAEVFLSQCALHGAETPNRSPTYSPLLWSIHKLLDLCSRRNARWYAHPSLTLCAASRVLRLFLVVFGSEWSTMVIFQSSSTIALLCLPPWNLAQRNANSLRLNPVLHILPALRLKTSLFISCVPTGMLFSGLALLIRSEWLIFLITNFIPWWAALCSAYWSPSSGTASRSLLWRPFPICSYRDRSRLSLPPKKVPAPTWLSRSDQPSCRKWTCPFTNDLFKMSGT